jgi:hypothetical protein
MGGCILELSGTGYGQEALYYQNMSRLPGSSIQMFATSLGFPRSSYSRSGDHRGEIAAQESHAIRHPGVTWLVFGAKAAVPSERYWEARSGRALRRSCIRSGGGISMIEPGNPVVARLGE